MDVTRGAGKDQGSGRQDVNWLSTGPITSVNFVFPIGMKLGDPRQPRLCGFESVILNARLPKVNEMH